MNYDISQIAVPGLRSMASIGRNLYEKTDSSGDPVVGNPGENGIGTISQHYLEMSNVSVVDEMVRILGI